MKKIIYYLKNILFLFYLIGTFLLIDKLFTIKPFGLIYFLLCLIYSFIMILSILSKKKCFINAVSYNLLSISIYIYTIFLCYLTNMSSKLTILSNSAYYKNNFVLLYILFIGLIFYTIELNKEE